MPEPYIPASGRVLPWTAGDLLSSERIFATCVRCGHQGEIDLWPWVERDGPDIPLGNVYRRLKCSKCGGWAGFPPKILSPRNRNALLLREIYKMKGLAARRAASE